MLVSLVVESSHPSAIAERLCQESTYLATQGSIQGMMRSEFLTRLQYQIIVGSF